jgi:hypothetical protein
LIGIDLAIDFRLSEKVSLLSYSGDHSPLLVSDMTLLVSLLISKISP